MSWVYCATVKHSWLSFTALEVILDFDVMYTSVFQESKIRTNFIELFPKENQQITVN